MKNHIKEYINTLLIILKTGKMITFLTNHRIIALIIIVLTIASCNAKEDYYSNKDSFSVHITGEIDTMDIEMFITAENRLVRGYYYYKKYNTPIKLLGYIDKNDSICLMEYSLDSNNDYTFESILKNTSYLKMSKTFKGVWTFYPKKYSFKTNKINNISKEVYKSNYQLENNLYGWCGMHCCQYLELKHLSDKLIVTRKEECVNRIIEMPNCLSPLNIWTRLVKLKTLIL